MVVLVMMLVSVGVVVLVMRAAAQGGPNPGARPTRSARPPRTARPTRALAPDDDPEFLRELERRARRDDGAAS
ncbi:MAG: uncharacterized protein JWP46_999 [Modestobacter sp.]|jgi:hypothetical protein|nr:uncharacterized protein [Modestobacter sp.]MCW2677542.1 uncharacterized protein [Modestobacter sp.]